MAAAIVAATSHTRMKGNHDWRSSVARRIVRLECVGDDSYSCWQLATSEGVSMQSPGSRGTSAPASARMLVRSLGRVSDRGHGGMLLAPHRVATTSLDQREP